MPWQGYMLTTTRMNWQLLPVSQSILALVFLFCLTLSVATNVRCWCCSDQKKSHRQEEPDRNDHFLELCIYWAYRYSENLSKGVCLTGWKHFAVTSYDGTKARKGLNCCFVCSSRKRNGTWRQTWPISLHTTQSQHIPRAFIVVAPSSGK